MNDRDRTKEDLIDELARLRSSLQAAETSKRPTPRDLKVLLAEDNEISQKVAVKTLEKLGHTVSAVRNGREAAEALTTGPFDLVLMDIRMPEMDGLQAARAIRKWEAGSDRRVPIIALTGTVVDGDRERFLEAGMDSFIMKPLTCAALTDFIESFTFQVLQTDELPNGSNHGDDVIDRSELIDRIGDDPETLNELIEAFLESYPRLLKQAREAVQDGDADTLRRAAHSLKGILANYSARAALCAAMDLENVAARDVTEAGTVLEKLETELDRFVNVLLSMRKG